MAKLKTKSNFSCRIAGWSDRIFRLIALNNNGIAVSSFIESRKVLFINEESEAIDKAQRSVIAARIKSEEIMAQFSGSDIELISNGHKDVYEKRRREKTLRLFEELVAIRNEIKVAYVKLHADLDDTQAQLKRQLTAYLLAAFSRKKNVDIISNASVDYKDMISYKSYLESYEYADRGLNEVADTIVHIEALCKYFRRKVV